MATLFSNLPLLCCLPGTAVACPTHVPYYLVYWICINMTLIVYLFVYYCIHTFVVVYLHGELYMCLVAVYNMKG